MPTAIMPRSWAFLPRRPGHALPTRLLVSPEWVRCYKVSKRNIKLSYQTMTPIRELQQGPTLSTNLEHDLEQSAAESNLVKDLILPLTFVTPSLSAGPGFSDAFFRFQYQRFKTHLWDWISMMGFQIGSKPSWFKAAQWRPRRAQLVPTAKTLHQVMHEALAAGDRATLRQMTTDRMYARLDAAIEARPRGRSYGWELVKYTRPLFYPRVVDHKVGLYQDGQVAKQQAVVAIASRQRLVQYDDATRLVPGSERERDLLEYFVIVRDINMTSYTQGDWLVWGTREETTPESWADDLETVALSHKQNQRISS